MKGVLLVNLGSPESPTAKDVKPYLDEFLMDKYVIDYPYIFRALLVRGIILRTRPEKSAEAYRRIWWDEGSPLIVISKRLQQKVAQQVNVPVALAMRYGNPSIESGLRELYDKGIREVMLFPLYPQYAMATIKTIVILAEEVRKKHFPDMKFTHIKPFYNNSDYIEAQAATIRRHLQDFDFDHILFSYHGVPERHIRKTDPTKSHCKIDSACCFTPSPAHEFCYRHQCFETTRLLAEALNLPREKYSQSFQSRLGNDKWLEPYTDATLESLPSKGVKRLAVVTPAFVSDCLETLEEIGMEGAHQFKSKGGDDFFAVPCMNDDPEWVSVVAGRINEWASVERV